MKQEEKNIFKTYLREPIIRLFSFEVGKSVLKYSIQVGKNVKNHIEQDFLIQKGKDIIPIEVKAEGNIRSQSLKAYCDKYHPRKAVRLSTLNYVDQGWMVNIPLYAVCNL